MENIDFDVVAEQLMAVAEEVIENAELYVDEDVMFNGVEFLAERACGEIIAVDDPELYGQALAALEMLSDNGKAYRDKTNKIVVELATYDFIADYTSNIGILQMYTFPKEAAKRKPIFGGLEMLRMPLKKVSSTSQIHTPLTRRTSFAG